ncbi:cytochrome o ubiquinol oxidase subunit IV [Pseudoduganella armeniaca]|uniref:Cytochrome bo(3) ubiquinol oxidase subunit 4 n=1 Tax=Pseudoduganella armeniaca TaxID=2072590 RepID=A0A2R4CBR2_9BURK|nr:cytochrome o ubiquinol oxidase subunit IV [Pseudoduganella armeniaca]AVR97002.1 cytochrome o ubiquinol oxidase subunit IV [Pseudoduganella armeniaca]
MSEHHHHHGHGDHGHGHDDHGHGHDDGSAVHGSMKDYVIGFVLSVILTAIPFWLVMNNVIESPATTAYVILGFAAVQMVVHMVYFLHMNSKSEGGWNMLALIFTVIIVVITLAGSIWVMYHMNKNMMPAMEGHTPQQVHDMP